MASKQTLEMEIKTTAEQAKNKLDQVLNVLNSIDGKVGNVSNKLGTMASKTNTATSSTKKLGIQAQSTEKALSKMTTAINFGAIVAGTKKAISAVQNLLKTSINYSEQMNLFNVTFNNVKRDGVQTYSELGKAAIQYQNKLNENFGTNMQETLKFQSLFQSMGESSSIGRNYAAIMSETMTNMSYDLASLFNREESDTAEAIRAGVFAGQTKPLRTFGVDVTQTSMKPLLQQLGITDRTVADLNFAEKQILRYLAVLGQAENAMGDYANTVESPANQMKVFANLCIEAKTAVSSLFVGAFANVLPYANALLMVIKEVSYAIADMFGIEMSDYNTGIAGVEDNYDDLGDAIDDANGKAKELKRTLLGFDQVHNINDAKNGGSGSIIGGGIDQRLLDAIRSYDNGLDKVRMKASEIRDRIMSWLGFTKMIDEETGRVYFKFIDTDSTLARLVKSFKDILYYGTETIKKVFEVIINDFSDGMFGEIVTKVFEGIAGALKSISENEAAVDTIAKIVEAILLVKGVTFVAQITGLSSLLGLLGKIAGINGFFGVGQAAIDAEKNIALFSNQGLTNIQKLLGSSVANTGLLGVLGVLTVMAETYYLIRLGMDGYEAVRNKVQTISLMMNQWGDNVEDVIEQFNNLSDKTPEAIQTVTGYVERAISNTETWLSKNKLTEKGYKDINETLDKYYERIKSYEAFDPDTYKKHKEQLDNLRKAVQENYDASKNAMKGMSDFKSSFKELPNSKTIKIGLDTSSADKTLKNWGNSISVDFSLSKKALGGVFNNGSWSNIPQYANGGSPTHGTMFVAGENGSEIVGNINRRTEVLNRSQIASSIYSAVLSAMNQAGGGTSQIDVHVHTDEGTIVDRINQTTKRTGTCPIDMPY